MKGVIQSQRSRTDRVYSVVGIEIYMYTYLFQLWKSVFMCQGNIRFANFSPLFDLSPASHKRDIGKQCRPRSDAAEAPIVTENNKIWAAHDRTYNRTCVTSKDQPVHPPSMANVFVPFFDSPEALEG